MMDRFLNWITSFLHYKEFYRVLPDGTEEVYLRRYRIWGTLRGEGGKFGIYLHKIMSGDADRYLHCHPWSFLSIMLHGSYWEETFDRNHTAHKKYKAPAFLWRPLIWKHKLWLRKNTHVWTFIIRGEAKRNWGFWKTNEGPMIPNENYRDAAIGRYEVRFSKDPDSE